MNVKDVTNIVNTAKAPLISLRFKQDGRASLLWGIEFFCTRSDNPGGDWEKVDYQRRAVFVGTVYVCLANQQIRLGVTTTAWAFIDSHPRICEPSEIFNRPDDIQWTKNKWEQLCATAGVLFETPKVVNKDWQTFAKSGQPVLIPNL
jgi:hypothetical protein